ncbi:FUSC family protein [Caballeronia insecticola]|uniref:Fusaric acid resistance protein conserved region n=1 Tax=Caballeronia insecticola TaxID=758793 RepID=R4X3Y6_9BURK|nr:FUSC family protein [Caballeronia insecticola]BAN27771.1 fusaric acid resistance protein conserved region [Caballeronia insecticola]
MDTRYSIEGHAWKRVLRMHLAHWAATDGLVWLHLAKTLTAAFLAMGIAMKLEIPTPRTAMATVFVLMQPQSGMVLSKSFYRMVGTVIGTAVAVLLGALFPQQPDLYIGAMTLWVALCTAAALRYRNFRWYAFVLAGYTAALIGIPTALEPNALYIGALNRSAAVLLGIVCSGVISAIVLPQWSSTRLKHIRRERFVSFSNFAAKALQGEIDRPSFRMKYGEFIDSVVGFEATRAFASFEDPEVRSRSRRLARLNNTFMGLCTRLHALHRFVATARESRRCSAIDRVASYCEELAHTLAVSRDIGFIDDAYIERKAALVSGFRLRLAEQIDIDRRALERTASADELLDFDTATQLLSGFISEYSNYVRVYVSLVFEKHVLEETDPKRVSVTNTNVIAVTFLMTCVVLGTIGALWLSSDWPSGGYAIIGAAAVSALGSNSPTPIRFSLQMASGAALATLAGCFALRYLYPSIEGFPLLCFVLAPMLGLGAFLATRPKFTGLGLSFCIFFCVLGGPDRVIQYAPEPLLNNGIALTLAMLACAAACAIVFPAEMPWRVSSLIRDLRAQIVLACTGPLDDLHEIFQSGAHDIVAQLRALLPRPTPQYVDALAWILVVIELGHAAIELRIETRDAQAIRIVDSNWRAMTDETLMRLMALFEAPSNTTLQDCVRTIDLQTNNAEKLTTTLNASTHDILQVRRMLARLHFMRSVMLDRAAPFQS